MDYFKDRSDLKISCLLPSMLLHTLKLRPLRTNLVPIGQNAQQIGCSTFQGDTSTGNYNGLCDLEH